MIICTREKKFLPTFKVDQINHDTGAIKVFGFWTYLMSDCILFCCLFATYIVLINGTANGPHAKDIIELPLVLVESIVLLLSSITYSISVNYAEKRKKNNTLFWMCLTWLFGFSFIGTEIYEFVHMNKEGYCLNRSGFLSAFFTLVGTHGLHVTSGLIWMSVLIFQIIIRGFTNVNYTRIMCLSLFWHFLDIIWICLFSVVYLLGAIK